MSVTNVTVVIPEIAAGAVPGITSLVQALSFGPATHQMGELPTVVAPGLLLGLFGVPLFGIFGTLVLVMFVASAFGGRSREHGNPTGLGLVIGFMVLFIIMLLLNVALR